MSKLSHYFGTKEAVILALAIAISVTIFLGRNSLSDLVNLGYVGVFLVALLGNATLILPAPALVFVFAAGSILPLPLIVGLVAGLGATIGECTGYAAGYGGNKLIAHTAIFTKFKAIVEKYGARAIALLAFIPNPLFDIAGMAAGAMKMPLPTFFFATLAGKTLKTILVAFAGSLSIEWVRHFF